MDINSLFNKIVNNLDLGNITEGPIQVTGGLTHRMFRIFTDKGRYIIKLFRRKFKRNHTI